LNASGRNKRRRTSEVWQYFDEVTENGEIWAKCKSCSNRYRGESKRGTTNIVQEGNKKAETELFVAFKT